MNVGIVRFKKKDAQRRVERGRGVESKMKERERGYVEHGMSCQYKQERSGYFKF